MNKSLSISSIAIAVAVTVALATSASGAKIQARNNGYVPANTWQSVPGVTLTSEQRDRITDMRHETQNRIQSIRNDSSLTHEEQDRRCTEAQGKGHERVMTALTLQQRQQLDQHWQVRPRSDKAWNDDTRGTGPKAQKHGNMGADIGQGVPGVTLTREQKDSIADIRDDVRSRIQSIRKNGNLTREERETMITRAQADGHERVLAALSLQQRRQLDQRWQTRPGTDPHGNQGSQRTHGNVPGGNPKH